MPSQERHRSWTWPIRRALAVAALIGPALLLGPATPAPAAAAAELGEQSAAGSRTAMAGATARSYATPVDLGGLFLAPAGPSPAQVAALGAHLSVDYAGAVPAGQVQALVDQVTRQLVEASSPADRLMQTAEAVCRRALTDRLALGLRS